ncbi:recombinase family protein [Nocardia aurea]|uniref:recombinase family protein n=1 Tax=Nocardia aurea TaxID=2144174 RepID=UPI0033AA6B18
MACCTQRVSSDSIGDRRCAACGIRRQRSHRSGDGWQEFTVRAILENPRYTGYAVFGRWSKHEELLDPDDVAAGHVVRFKRANQDRIVRSRRSSPNV